METYANDYEVGEFERQLTTNFTCYRHERYPTQFVLPEDLAVSWQETSHYSEVTWVSWYLR